MDGESLEYIYICRNAYSFAGPTYPITDTIFPFAGANSRTFCLLWPGVASPRANSIFEVSKMIFLTH